MRRFLGAVAIAAALAWAVGLPCLAMAETPCAHGVAPSCPVGRCAALPSPAPALALHPPLARIEIVPRALVRWLLVRSIFRPPPPGGPALGAAAGLG